MQTVSLNSFSFTLAGLQFNYLVNGKNTILSLDPKATCSLLQVAGMIEGFDTDSNGEPVILFTDHSYPEGYGFDQWCYFVKFFPISYRIAQTLVEYREENKAFRKAEAKIIYMLQPLQAA
jgi:hypothetical protein